MLVRERTLTTELERQSKQLGDQVAPRRRPGAGGRRRNRGTPPATGNGNASDSQLSASEKHAQSAAHANGVHGAVARDLARSTRYERELPPLATRGAPARRGLRGEASGSERSCEHRRWAGVRAPTSLRSKVDSRASEPRSAPSAMAAARLHPSTHARALLPSPPARPPARLPACQPACSPACLPSLSSTEPRPQPRRPPPRRPPPRCLPPSRPRPCPYPRLRPRRAARRRGPR